MVDAYDYGTGGVPTDKATTTFGPLEKYVAANDNVPVAHQPARGPFERPPYTVFKGDNPHMEMTPEDRLPQGLTLLASLPGYIYLGSPYSKYEAGHDAAARVVADSAAALMRRGLVIYSPIAHGHAVAAHGLPLDWGFWKRQCQPLIDGAAGLIVLTMAGWQESIGLQYEIEEFVRAGKPILHVSPRWLVENKVGGGGWRRDPTENSNPRGAAVKPHCPCPLRQGPKRRAGDEGCHERILAGAGAIRLRRQDAREGASRGSQLWRR